MLKIILLELFIIEWRVLDFIEIDVLTNITGLYSRKAFQRLGFEVVTEYEYKDYQDEATGEKVFASIEDKHRCVSVMTKKFDVMEDYECEITKASSY